ncbi:MAG TPA: PD-(D/E)XK nuclease family protein [Candidatus Paceibacterota bacterium]|nr:PD-(D/E)XK nuclease family protein [Candidatus Paceibacterota bacterium]
MATKLSRSKLELFTECRRCFWLDLKQGIKRPSGPPFTLNNAVDYLLKEEFDVHRNKKTRHPVMEKFEINALPFQHDSLSKWRHNFTGVQVNHEPTGFLVYGAVDDLWVNPDGQIHVVDYKATGAKEHKIYDSYRRQMEIYQWLLRHNGLDVSPRGYFVFAKVNKADGFGNGDAALAFDLFIEPLDGDDSWVEQALQSAKKTFDMTEIPDATPECDFCSYRHAVARAVTE